MTRGWAARVGVILWHFRISHRQMQAAVKKHQPAGATRSEASRREQAQSQTLIAMFPRYGNAPANLRPFESFRTLTRTAGAMLSAFGLPRFLATIDHSYYFL